MLIFEGIAEFTEENYSLKQINASGIPRNFSALTGK